MVTWVNRRYFNEFEYWLWNSSYHGCTGYTEWITGKCRVLVISCASKDGREAIEQFWVDRGHKEQKQNERYRVSLLTILSKIRFIKTFVDQMKKDAAKETDSKQLAHLNKLIKEQENRLSQIYEHIYPIFMHFIFYADNGVELLTIGELSNWYNNADPFDSKMSSLVHYEYDLDYDQLHLLFWGNTDSLIEDGRKSRMRHMLPEHIIEIHERT